MQINAFCSILHLTLTLNGPGISHELTGDYLQEMLTTKNKDSERNLYSGAVQLIGGKGYNMLNLISAQSVLPLITCLKTLAV